MWIMYAIGMPNTDIKRLPLALAMTLILTLAVTWASAKELTFPRYAAFLKKYACPQGVNYAAIKSAHATDSLLQEFTWQAKDSAAASESERLAYLINLYNVSTIKWIAKHYPVASIRDIPDTWKQNIVPWLGKKVDLDFVENQLIRGQFKEPRIHFALNCASRSCPDLFLQPFVAHSLEKQLQAATLAFLQDTKRNQISADSLKVSQIFSWYGNDFVAKYGGYKAFIDSQLQVKIKLGASTRPALFLPYDWKLNDATDCNGN
jgi:hypothetical protein